MTKRILAAVLAVMMVVGLLPTSVFAANPAECVVWETYGDHSKIHCDLAKVSYTKVPNSTVEPECGQDGYTLYQCACGAYFADDIIPMDDHIKGSVKAETVEPTCYATGKAAIFVCKTCGKDYFDPAETRADAKGVIAKTKHTFDQVSYPGNNCMAAEQVCENEGCTAKNTAFKPQTAHNWVYDDPHAIVKAPTAHDTGLAEFKCGNEGCAQTKTVKVAELDHKSTMKKVEAKTPDCKNEGNIEYWLCTVCNKKFVEDATTGDMLEVEDKDVVLEKKHEWNDDPVIILPTCLEWGFSYYGCPLCGATKGVTEETKDEEITKYKPLGHTPYACAEHEEIDAECEDCSSYGQSITEPNCTTKGSYNWVCGRCHKPQSAEIAKTGHTTKSFTVPGNHKNAYTYKVTYCTNENCPNKAIEEYTYRGEKLDVTVEVRDGNVYDMPAGSTFHVTTVTAIKKVTTGLVHFYIEDQAVQAPTCTEPGKAFWYCVGDGCNDHHDEVLPATGHNYDDESNDIEATCTENLRKVCDNEGCLEAKEIKNTAGHVLTGEKVRTSLPTCTGELGYDWYICERCKTEVEDPKSETKFVANKTYLGREDLNMTAKQEFLAEHKSCDDSDFVPYREGDCVNNGYWRATCDDCDKTYLVLIDDTGKGHKVPAGTAYYEEATCTDAQGYAQYVCERCGETVKPAGKALGHAMTAHKAVAPTCTEDGNKAYWTCSRACCKDILYKDAKGKATYAVDEQIDPATDHNLSVTVVAANCKTDGFTHTICTNKGCDLEYVDGFLKMTGHKNGSKRTVAASCTVDGLETIPCTNANCTGDDGDAGTEDDAIASQKVLPATGHKNSAKQTIVDICTDTVTNRTCTNTNHNTQKDGPKTVGKAHAIVKETVEPGCEHFGYEMETCANGCGTKDKVINIVPALGHLTCWGQYIKADDFSPVDEDDVAPYGEEFLETDPEDYTGHIKAYTPATYESLGSVTFECCAHCGDEITRDVIRIGMDFTVEVDNAAVSGAEMFVDGDVIAVDVYMNAYKTNTWGFNFDFEYAAATMNFLGYKYHLGDVFSSYMVNNNTADVFEYDYNDIDNDGILDEYAFLVEDAEGKVSVSAYTEKELDGKKVDVLVEGTQKVITLYFQLEAEVELIYKFLPETFFRNYASGGIENAWMSNTKGEDACDGDYFEFETAMILDTNNNGVFNIKDLQNCYEICKGVEGAPEYLAAADANKDGIVDLTDLDLMNKYLVGKVTEKDLYAAIEWTDIAPEGFVAC